MRQKVQKSIKLFHAVKKKTNTNILEGLDEASIRKKSEEIYATKSENRPPAELSGENSAFSFANTINVVSGVESRNPLHKSGIYDSGAAYHLTFDKNRFVGEIAPSTSEVWIGTPNRGMMPVQGYGTMLVKGTLNGKPRDLLFEGTAYVPDADVTLVAANKLKRRGFFWNMHDDSLINKETGEKICEMEEHYNLSILEFNEMPVGWSVNAINLRHPEKATLWVWHLRLGHCRPQVIDQIRKIPDVEVLKGEAPKSVHCTTCAVSKMHEIIQRSPAGRATKPYEVLHFDLMITNIGFEGTKCIAHFTDEFITFN